MELIVFLLSIAVVGGLLIYSSLSWGFVLHKFYYWFLLPVFPELPQINFWQAVGLYFIVGLFHNHNSKSLKEELYEKDKYSRAAALLFTPWLMLIIGWFIHSLFF